MAADRGLRSLSPILPALALLLSGFAAGRGAAPQTARATPALATRWTADVTPDRVLPEYPRPQLMRPDWLNLNGFWDYAVVARTAPAPETFDGRILVPFAIQSHLSGVARAVGPDERVWYRRWFRAPARLPRHRLLLHFGAVDWEAVVYVNGRQVGEHRGGYDPFTFDITEALSEGPEQQLLVAVWDPTDKGPQPRGKQVLEPHGIWYTAVTGIWQTVWLEPVAETHVDHLAIAPENDLSGVTVAVAVGGPSTRDLVTLTALDHETPVATATGIAGERLTLRLPHPRLWSPSDPFLYGLRVRLASGDAVESYFGLRTIDVATDARGFRRLFLNHAPLFEFGLLDQGWWPDGLYTAPTDAALAFDLETTRNLGFNTIRKHVKVEPARWYYHADRLGLLVWQDMPSGDNDTADARAGFARELERVVDALDNHPSIVMWVPFNEGWGQHDTRRYVEWLQARDPTRLVDNASGWMDEGAGQVSDAHAYPGPARPLLEDDRAAVLGEFGGLGLPLEGHTWIDKGNWGYRSYESPAALGRAYRDLLYQLRLLTGEGLAAAIYTQTTDVEVEVNGVMTYDRAVVKLPRDVAALNAQLFAEPPLIATIVPASDVSPQNWRYTFASPAGRWYDPAFADRAWKTGRGGFGRSDTPRAKVGTIWDTPDIWLRRTFELDTSVLRHPLLRIYHDEDAEVYLNGRLIASLSGYTGGYSFVPLDAEAASVLQSGQNTIAIHVHQTRGGQFIDAGLVDVEE
jgi:hypothetical protein